MATMPHENEPLPDLLAKLEFAQKYFLICDRHPPRSLEAIEPPPELLQKTISLFKRQPRYNAHAGYFSSLLTLAKLTFEELVTIYAARVQIHLVWMSGERFFGGGFAQMANWQSEKHSPSLCRAPGKAIPHFYSLDEFRIILGEEFALSDELMGAAAGL